ncbi:MAG: family 43 glycosylhydrolase, partial [Vallitaleaceae bacterium]|nr:family 43 glycosylhydrolase [Vallitaleaceae bacterium]
MELAIGTNPIMKADFPDPDVIRVGDTYYMISTTMHFMPGGAILQSFDLINWEIISYVYEQLEDDPAHSLEHGQSIYGQGMWAASLRFYKNTYYVLFSANETKHSYLFQSKDIRGPWIRKDLHEFYHDPSLLFDEDEKVYVVYGNTEIWIQELEKDSFLPKKGGLFRQIIKDMGNIGLGYEGSHMYKIHGNYYVFLIHWRTDGTRRRTQACYVSTSLEGEFTGKEVLDDDMQYHNQGIAQGGIVDTPQGDWYAILFQDRGAVGRIPILLPLQWHKNFPVFGIDEKVPMVLKTVSTRPNHQYEPLCASDDFRDQGKEGQATQLKKVWQWNHNPNKEAWKLNPEKGILYLKTVKTSINILQASNCLTQRLLFPKCVVEVNIDG